MARNNDGDEMAGGDPEARRGPTDDAMSRAHASPDADAGGEGDEAPLSFADAAKAALATHKAEPAAADDDENDEPAAGGKKPAAKAADEGQDDEVLTDAEYAALEEAAGGDAKKLRTSLVKAIAAKTGADRASYEKVKPYVDLIEAYESDALGTLEILAERNGLRVVKAEGADGKDGKDGKDAAAPTPEEAHEEMLATVREELGEDLDYLAEPVARVMAKLVDKLAGEKVNKAVEPLLTDLTARGEERAQQVTEGIMASLTEKHPDWKDHEPKMLELSQKLVPGPQMTEIEYLETLYNLATEPARESSTKTTIAKEADKKAAALVSRMRKGADASERASRSTPDKQVTVARPANASFAEAAAAAIRGERWEE